jgi:outer membrane protein assembly factor BamB
MKNLSKFSPLMLLAVSALTITCRKSSPVDITLEPIPQQMSQTDIPWPSLANSPWPMYLHDPQHTGRSPYRGPQQAKAERLFETSNSVYSSPALDAAGNVYFGSDDGYLYCIRSDGVLNWKFKTDAERVKSSPLVCADGTVLFSAASSTSAYFYALTASGTLKWRTVGKADFASVLSIDGASVFVGAYGLPALAALRTTDGSVRWEVDVTVSYSLAMSPDGKTIHAGTADGCLVAVDTSGVVRWKSEPLGGYVSSPCVDNAGNIYVNGGEYCWAFNPDGTARWKYFISAYDEQSSPSIGWNGSIYTVGDRVLYSLDYSGKLKWSYELASVGGTPTGYGKISENTPVLDIDETIYLGTLTWRTLPDTVNFVIINANGTLEQAVTLKSPEVPGVPPEYLYPDIDSTPAVGPGVIYVGSDRPQGVYLYKITN